MTARTIRHSTLIGRKPTKEAVAERCEGTIGHSTLVTEPTKEAVTERSEGTIGHSTLVTEPTKEAL